MNPEEKSEQNWSFKSDDESVQEIFKDRTVRKMFDLKKGKFYTTDEVADILNVEKEVIRDLIRRNELFAIKIGKAYRVTESDIQDFLHERYTPVIRSKKPDNK